MLLSHNVELQKTEILFATSFWFHQADMIPFASDTHLVYKEKSAASKKNTTTEAVSMYTASVLNKPQVLSGSVSFTATCLTLLLTP